MLDQSGGVNLYVSVSGYGLWSDQEIAGRWTYMARQWRYMIVGPGECKWSDYSGGENMYVPEGYGQTRGVHVDRGQWRSAPVHTRWRRPWLDPGVEFVWSY
jgi:hypothetical protein